MGCFFMDLLPTFLKQFPGPFIMNTAASSEPGKHWVAVVLQQDECLYFDPVGVGVIEL